MILNTPRPMQKFKPLVFFLFINIIILDCFPIVFGVVVDGRKRSELSATRHHPNDEKSSIDPFNVKTCGMADPNYSEHEFINMAREGQFPWIVSLQIKILGNSTMKEQMSAINENLNDLNSPKKRSEDLHFCSGAFISDKWVLSAAHCFAGDTIISYMKNNKLKIVAGSHKVASTDKLNNNLAIKRVYYHSKFDRAQPLGFDIALIELDKKVELNHKRVQDNTGHQSKPFMNAICLPHSKRKYKFNETARIAGWGLSDVDDIHSMPSKLLTTDILVSNKTQCVEKYSEKMNSTKPLEQMKKHNDFICANYKDSRDTCQSDSGGPLMQYVERKAVSIGIVSYGIGCATKGVPGVYTRISAYINWIRDITINGRAAKVHFKLLEIQMEKTGEVTIIKDNNKPKSTSSTVAPTETPEDS